MSKVVCIVQARMSSERLPGKVMKPILGKPMISYTLNRLKKCGSLDEVVLATSALSCDDPLEEYAKSAGFEYVRGSEDDVLERYVLANKKYNGDVVVRVTGDCPLIDPSLVDLTVNAFLTMGKDYVSLNKKESAMRGLDTEVFSAEALYRTYDIVSSLKDFKNYKEHVTIYMYSHPEEFSIGSVLAPDGILRPYRLCVDEIEDFKVVEAIFNNFKHPYPTAFEIVDFLDNNKEIAMLNSGVEQKKS